MINSNYDKIIIHKTYDTNNASTYEKQRMLEKVKKQRKGDGGAFDKIFEKELQKLDSIKK